MFKIDIVLPRHTPGFELPARIRFRLHNGEVIIAADPNKRERDEEPSLHWIEAFGNILNAMNITHEALMRNTGDDCRRDTLRIPVENLRTRRGQGLHSYLPREMCTNLRVH